jgi:hypothetical protein
MRMKLFCRRLHNQRLLSARKQNANSKPLTLTFWLHLSFVHLLVATFFRLCFSFFVLLLYLLLPTWISLWDISDVFSSLSNYFDLTMQRYTLQKIFTFLQWHASNKLKLPKSNTLNKKITVKHCNRVFVTLFFILPAKQFEIIMLLKWEGSVVYKKI